MVIEEDRPTSIRQRPVSWLLTSAIPIRVVKNRILRLMASIPLYKWELHLYDPKKQAFYLFFFSLLS